MGSRKAKYSMMSPEDEEKINYLMPDIVLAVEALQLATADRIQQCLEECDIKATPSQILMALEYGCKLGLMEERTRYRLNPELLNRGNCFVDCSEQPQGRVMPPCCMPKEKKKEEEPEDDDECKDDEEKDETRTKSDDVNNCSSVHEESDGAVGPDTEKAHQNRGVKTTKEDGEEKNQSEKKLTVLETHGYTLGKTIGTGSYATVKVARSERHDCLVAVKIVSKFQAPADYLKKFLPREIEVVKGLKHINLIRFLQAIETTHRVYIIMEYAENGSLLDVIRKDQYIDEIRARKYFRQLVDAVDYCHERGVVHRDIKCENLLMDHENNVKLSDFGFARGHMRIKNGVAPLSDTFCGSYAYASPEILKGVPYQPQLSDIWSMGVVLYAIVYGRLPFDDTNYNQLLKQVQSKITFPKEPKISGSCKTLIIKILAPVKFRLRIPGIRSDPWFTQGPSDTTSSRQQGSEDTLPSMRSTRSSSGGTPVQLMTKETLKANSSKPEKVRSSTEEEYPLETTGPRSRSNSRIHN